MNLPRSTTRALRRLFRLCTATTSALVFAAALQAQSTPTGTIEGRVLDARRGEYLEKARIVIDGTNQEVLTDSTGNFRIANVAPGSVTLKIFYTGLGTQTQTVIVGSGQRVVQDITFGAPGAPGAQDAIKLEAFTVSSSKEMDGAALAMNEQRFARNIMQVVSADEFGTIADGSIGEFMKFLPGMTSDYTGGDARRVSINGAPADNVPISMGGFEMASAAGANSRRAVELDQVSINNIARLEINRSPTPDTPGAALAGSVNLVPRSAFERSRPSYSYNAQLMFKDAESTLGKTPGPRWGEWTRKVNPAFDLSAIVPVSKTFGFSISGGYSLQYTPQPNAAMQWRGAHIVTNQSATATPTGTGQWFPDTTPQNPYLGTFSWRDSGKHTTRHSFATTVDWKPAQYDRLTFGFQYGMLKENFATRSQTFQINRVFPGNWTPTHTWGMASTYPTTGTPVNSGQITINNSGRIRPGRTVSPSLRWLHDGPTWKADTGAAYGNSRIHYQDIDLGAFNGVNIQRNNVQILFDDINYLRPGKITVLDHLGRPVDWTDLDQYAMTVVNSNRQKTYDTVKQAYSNVRRDFYVKDMPLTLKAGIDVRQKVRDMRGPGGNLEEYTFVGADGITNSTRMPYSQTGVPHDDNLGRFIDDAFSRRIPDFGMPQQEFIDNKKVWEYYKANPTHFTRNLATEYQDVTTFSRRAEEIISAAFFRVDNALFGNRLKLTWGLRAEQTNIDAEGPLTDPTLAYQRDANGNVVRNAAGQPQFIVPPTPVTLAYNQLTIIDRGYNVKKEYLRLFPSINASYNFSENIIGRVSYYETVGRPDFNEYMGGLQLPNTENQNPNDRITVSNVSLKAWQAQTYMARFEYYIKGGEFSLMYYVRNYDNMYGNVTTPVTPEFLDTYSLDPDTYGIYQVVTKFNVQNPIRQKGFEISYRQQLHFLPNWARGVSVMANISSQRAKNSFDYLTAMNPFTANWGISLVRPKFNIRINENYRGIQRRAAIATARGVEAGTYNYAPKRLYIDVSGEYYLKRNLGVFISIRNIGSATEDTKIYGPNTPRYAHFRQRDDYASLWTVGVKGSF